MKRRASWLILVGVALLLVSCATVPMQSGLNLVDVRTVKPQGDEYTIVEIDTNPAASMSEPYPSMLFYIYKPAAIPEKIKRLEKEAQALAARLVKTDKNSSEFKSLQIAHDQTAKEHNQAWRAWLATAKPEEVLKTPNGDYYRAVGIDFKDREGRLIEPCQDGKIVADAKTLMTIEPWYGGKKRVIIAKSFKFLADQGYRAVGMTNDDSPAKRVFGFDGKGVMGEKWGTPYSAFNPQVHGERFVYHNPRMYGVTPGSAKDKEIQIWCWETILKAAIVAYKNDAVELGLHLGLKDYVGFALDPFGVRYISRKTSRGEALRQAVGNWDFAINPTIVYGWPNAAFSLGVSVSTKIIHALFTPKHFFIFGSAGTPVTRYDWAVGQLESGLTDEASRTVKERNRAALRYNDLALRYEVETDQVKKAVLEKELAEAKAAYRRLTNLQP